MGNLIRVLCVFSTLDRGGAESMCMELYRHIDREKIQFDFVKHTSKKGAFEDEIISMGGRIYEAPRLNAHNFLKYRNWWKNHLDSHPEHQIIHGHFYIISAIYFQIAKQKNRITVAHVHNSKASRPSREALAKFISLFADYRLACSQIAGRWAYGKKPFYVLNNAIDTHKFQANTELANSVREEFALGKSFVVGNVARFNLQKNPYGTLEIFRMIHDNRPNSKLLWVGEGDMQNEIQNKAEEYGIRNDIVFTGVRRDVHRLLQAMDVFVFPSFYEGLGIAVVEAQAAGVETFCSDTVPIEAGVTELCHFLPLDNLELWVDMVCNIPAASVHPDMTEKVINAGYDINDTAKWISKFYTEISNKSS